MLPVLWEIFLRSPIYGTGPDQYQFELTRRAMPYLVREQRTISAHNLALLLLVETGLIGFLLFSFGLKEALIGAWRARVNACGLLPLALIMPLTLAAATASNPSSAPIFWLAMAYALAGGGGAVNNDQ
jgi:O-antigen ligase